MGLLNAALQIGRSALQSYEGALHVVGTNVSSAGSPDFTRLSPRLDPLQGAPISGDLQPGAGVALSAIQRNLDEALEGRLRLAIGASASASAQGHAIGQIEPLFDDLNGAGLSTPLSEFFRAFDELQNTPEDPAIRDLVINDGTRLADAIRELRGRLARLGEDTNDSIASVVSDADGLAGQIAQLNREITTAEASGHAPAAALRDQRDALLRQLAALMDVAVREQPDGTVNVYVGGEVLIQGSSVRGLTVVEQVDGETTRASVRLADTNQEIRVNGGRLHGLLLSRDQDPLIDQLDQLASALIREVNRIHADGQGLVGFRLVTGSSSVARRDVALDRSEAALSVTPQNGSFLLTVRDDLTGTPVAHRIGVTLNGTETGTTLESLTADINTQVQGVQASITSNNQLRLTAEPGFTFTFGYDGQEAQPDSSGVLAALGINTFFNGTDARDIGVNGNLADEPALVAAASVSLPGDGTTAGRIAALNDRASEALNGLSIPEFYRAVANSVAVRSAAVQEDADTAESVQASLEAQRESISGVNLDEEAISLVKFERAFQGTSRFIRVVDDLISELVALVR